MSPLRFVFGVHLHQPVGNFDHVFRQHLDDVYRPLLSRLAERRFLPVVLHVSGPLLEWLDAHEPAYLDFLGRLVADGQVELLLSGYDEPVLASLLRRDRIEQIGWMRDALRRRFGVESRGLWLTERVWEPSLTVDLAQAGVEYVLLDDRHFLVAGVSREALHAPFRTEHDGNRVALFPIDERLRYLVPFRPPEETVEYLRDRHAEGAGVAVLVDDGEKFGGWPGTKEWVYERGWLDSFLGTMEKVFAEGTVRLSTLSEALTHVPSAGLVYLPTASYREMEGWSLPAAAAVRLHALERELGEERMSGPDGALLRGGHWHGFFTKYPEANRMHKKMLALSALCRERGDPAEARRAIGRAQCNDAYWHGVFGGLYLPHLRGAIWRNLALAEGILRQGEPLAVEVVDLDGDGHDEIWVHSSRFSALVSPARGGAVEEYTIFEVGVNFADVLTRRPEAYHEPAVDAPVEIAGQAAPSIHELERAVRLVARPPYDADDRALFCDRVIAEDVTLDQYAGGEYVPLRSWVRQLLGVQVTAGDVVEIALTDPEGGFEKLLRFGTDGALEVVYRWDPAGLPEDSVFAPELTVARALSMELEPAVEYWSFPVTTVSRSERGLEETVQGTAQVPLFAGTAGHASIALRR